MSSVLRQIFPSFVHRRALFAGTKQFSISASAFKDDSHNKINGQIPTVVHHPEKDEPWIPPFIENFNEPINEKRSRLQYQSRKRGIAENGLLLGSFAKKHLADFNDEQLALYDRLINLPSNDWDIYNWAIGHKETPEEFDNQVMDLLKQHARNEDREDRIRMPDL